MHILESIAFYLILINLPSKYNPSITQKSIKKSKKEKEMCGGKACLFVGWVKFIRQPEC